MKKCSSTPNRKNVNSDGNRCTLSDLEELGISTNEEHSYSSVKATKESITENQDSTNRCKKKPCPICGKLLHARWLKKHARLHQRKKENINENRSHFTVVVDAENGIFCSSVNLSGPSYPVHVMKKTSGIQQTSFCDHSACIDLKETSKAGGNLSFECPHVRSVAYAKNGQIITLKIDSLTRMKEENFITSERFQEMKKLSEGDNDGSPLLVRIPSHPFYSKRYIYISVFTGEKRYWCKTGRTVVTFDTEEKTFTCQCSNQSRYCTHKALAKWFVWQEVPDLISSTPNSEESRERPPRHDRATSFLFEYLTSTKKIPEKIPTEVLKEFSQKHLDTFTVIPSEGSCHRCNGGLASEIAKQRSRIVLMNKVIEGNGTFSFQMFNNSHVILYLKTYLVLSFYSSDVTVYHKICPRCHISYRYQEWTQGIHNYNNSLFIGLDVCTFIRAGLLV